MGKLVYINYNKRLNTRQLQRKFQCKDLDLIATDDINYNSEWLTGEEGAANEWVYGEEGLTWTAVEDAMGVHELDGATTRTQERSQATTFRRRRTEEAGPSNYMTPQYSDDSNEDSYS